MGSAVSDRLALANAIEDAGIERAKAERVASVIVDLVHDSVATQADVQALGSELKADVAATRAELKAEIAAVRTELVRLDGKVEQIGQRTFNRLGALVAVVAGILFAALHYWPPHG